MVSWASRQFAAAKDVLRFRTQPVRSGPRFVEHTHRDVRGGGLRAAVFGVSDGLVSNVSLVLGTAGAHPGAGVVRLAGLAGLFGGSFSMAAGEYISMRVQREAFERELHVERAEIEARPESERAELVYLYESRGLDNETAEKIADALMADPTVALETHAREELGLDPAALGSPIQASVFSFVTFAVGALIPLAAFLGGSSGTGAIEIAIARQPFTSFGHGPTGAESRRLRAACAIGLSSGLLQHFELSFEAGIGGHLFRLGRILRRHSEEARNDLETQKEFELLGGQVAVPILDRETVLGVAVFDGRITGEPLVNSELELIFHFLEQLGLAIKNIWLHDQLAGNHEMMADILRELSSACVVVSQDLTVLHANKTARKYFSRGERRGGDMEFSDLPELLGTRVFQVLKTGAAISSFNYKPKDSPGTVYNIHIVPFQRQQAGLPAAALLMAEDLTQSEQLRRLEVEAANLRLLRTMADRLTHEIGNAMVRLSTYQQLLAEKLTQKAVDQEFLKLMERDWADDNKRVSRLVSQMRYLNVDALVSSEAFPLAPLLEEAYQEACKYQPSKAAKVTFDAGSKPVILTGNRAALKHAFAEVMLNALQANPADPKIGVRLHVEAGGNGLQGLQIEVEDNGAGFTPDAVQKGCDPFFTTRNVGLGLGLTVSRKIVETHHGRLEIISPKSGQARVVRISLPLDTSLTVQA